MVGMKDQFTQAHDWNLPDLPPLYKLFQFTEDVFLRRVAVNRWQGRYLISDSTLKRYFNAAKWIGLIDGNVRVPGGWVTGVNLDFIRDHHAIYHSKRVGILVNHIDIFNYASEVVDSFCMSKSPFLKMSDVRLELARYISSVRRRKDGDWLAQSSAYTCSCQIVSWMKNIQSQRKFEIHE